MTVISKSNELRIIREYNAPLSAVWEAWANPDQAAQWWGPRGFTLTTHSKDLRSGGHWTYTMHGPDGVDFPSETKYLEVEKHKKLVYDHGASEKSAPMFRVSVEFAESAGKTRMDMRMILPTSEAAEKTRKFVKEVGGEATWDRLAEYLEKQSSGKEKFVINRSFDVPIQTMFEMWTSADHLAKWMPPTGFNMELNRGDIRPGGSTFYCMSNESGMKMYGRAEYKEIRKPDRIVYTQQFCDESEKVTRHPMSPTWPETKLTTITLHEEPDNKTRVTIEWEPYGKTTDEEMETFVTARGGMTIGWTGSLDKLEEYLLALRK